MRKAVYVSDTILRSSTMIDVFQQNTASHMLVSSWMNKFDGLVAGFTTRLGGVSKDPFQSNNLGLHVNDFEQDVITNRKRLCQDLGFSFNSFTCAEQVHGNEVAIVQAVDKGKGRLSIEDTIQGADAMVTAEQDLLLISFYADCVPLLFVDPEKKVMALAHAGWKGTMGAIAKETVLNMVQHFNCRAEVIHAVIGPAIDLCCYEVDQRVIHAAKQLWEQEQLPQPLLSTCIKPINEEKAYINLKEINRQIMIKAGILSSHIELSKLCTGCRTDLFFSHRMEKGKTGRMASFIGWQERNTDHDSETKITSNRATN